MPTTIRVLLQQPVKTTLFGQRSVGGNHLLVGLSTGQDPRSLVGVKAGLKMRVVESRSDGSGLVENSIG